MPLASIAILSLREEMAEILFFLFLLNFIVPNINNSFILCLRILSFSFANCSAFPISLLATCRILSTFDIGFCEILSFLFTDIYASFQNTELLNI